MQINALGIVGVLLIGFCGPVHATPDEAPVDPSVSPPQNAESVSHSRIVWNVKGFLGRCQGDCAVTILAGREVRSSMTAVYGVSGVWIPPWRWDMGHAYFIGGSISRRLVKFWNIIEIEPEFGVGKRFGNQGAAELWVAIYLRWTRFPWNKYLITTVGFPTGISYVTREDQAEVTLNEPHVGQPWQHYFAPELTFALPRYRSMAFHESPASEALYSSNGELRGSRYG
jgi:hypothetical protein